MRVKLGLPYPLPAKQEKKMKPQTNKRREKTGPSSHLLPRLHGGLNRPCLLLHLDLRLALHPLMGGRDLVFGGLERPGSPLLPSRWGR